MSEPGAAWSVSGWRCALLAGATLGLILLCAVVAPSGSMAASARSGTDMGSMAMSAPVAGVCDGLCVSDAALACGAAAATAPTALPALAPPRGRERHLDLPRRADAPPALRSAGRSPTHWSRAAPVSLCVWRV